MANPFTPEEVSQILEAFFDAVGTRQYIGARYVPIFGRKGETSIEWDNSAPYEPLTIVLYQGNSFTSRQYVPAGTDINNTEFWAQTGNYNAQIEQYRLETLQASENAQRALDLLPSDSFTEVNTVKKYIDDKTSDIFDDFYYDCPVTWGTYDGTTYALVEVGKAPIECILHENVNVVQDAINNGHTVAINTDISNGFVMHNGVVQRGVGTTREFYEYICIAEDGTVFSMPYNSTEAQIIASGAKNVSVAYFRMLNNGTIVDQSESGLNLDTRGQRSIFFVDRYGNKYFLGTNGRTSSDYGLDYQQACALAISLGAYDCWGLDGGGSASLTYHGVWLQRGYDQGGLEPRAMYVSMAVPKKTENQNYQEMAKLTAVAANNVINKLVGGQVRPLTYLDNVDLNTVTFPGSYFVEHATNAPFAEPQSGYLTMLTLQNAQSITYAVQVFVSLSNPNAIFTRTYSSSTWNAWTQNGLEALTSAHVYSRLDQTADLDTLSVGIYNIPSVTVAQQMALPYKDLGKLIVFKTGIGTVVTQLFITRTNWYERCKISSSAEYSPWRLVNDNVNQTFYMESYEKSSTSAYISFGDSSVPQNSDIISAYATNYALLPFKGNNNNWYFLVFNSSGALVTETATLTNLTIKYRLRQYDPIN